MIDLLEDFDGAPFPEEVQRAFNVRVLEYQVKIQKYLDEIDALWEIVESLPVDPHDMEVHFWCDHG